MYIETSSDNNISNVFCSFERTDIVQISDITFCFNRFSNLTNDSLKRMSTFKIQYLFADNTWSRRYNIPKNVQYSVSSTQWTKLF